MAGFPDKRHQVSFILFLLAGLCLAAFNLFSHALTVDDAYISFRYLDNLLSGAGLVYNPGEYVEGYTNFLWIAILAPLRAAGMAPETASVLLSVSALAFIVYAVNSTLRRMGAGGVAAASAAILVCGSTSLAFWSMSGMETVFFAALLCAANLKVAADGRHTPVSSLLFGAATLTRPDGVLFFGASFLVYALASGKPDSRKITSLALAAAAFVILPAAHILFRKFYYGEWLPNTYYAKLGGVGPLWEGGVAYAARFLRAEGMILVPAALLGIFNPKARTPAGAALAAQVALNAFYVIKVGGDFFPFHRFIAPMVPMIAVSGGMGAGFLAGKFPRADERAFATLALVLALASSGMARFSHEEWGYGVIKEKKAERELVAAWVASNLKPGSVLAVNAAGLVPYRTGLYTIDMLGLNDRHIARRPASGDFEMFAQVGHLKYDGAYVLGRNPDLVLTSGAHLVPSSNYGEAVTVAANGTFPGDREFLRLAARDGRYGPVAVELARGRWMVAYAPAFAKKNDQSADARPVTPEQWMQRGMRLMESADFRGALQAFEKVLAADPSHVGALTNLAYCHIDLNQPARALPLFERALSIRPGDHTALFGTALSHMNMGNRDESVKLWKIYLETAPETPWKNVAREHLQRLGGR